MKKFTRLAFAVLFLSPVLSQAQNGLEPFIGYGIDVNNKQPLSQFNVGLQIPIIKKPIYQMLIGVRGSVPVNSHTGTDAAYTYDQALPLSITTRYKTKFYSAAITLTNRFKVVSWARKNTVSAFVNVGFGRLSIQARHDNYDMDKYTVLNPHSSLAVENLLAGAGIQYKRKLNTGYFFVQGEVVAPPFDKHPDNYNFKTPVPLSINLGYGIVFKKRDR
ncbi:MAG: hypothetical protein QM802_11350 [Agriterribacter sp.]